MVKRKPVTNADIRRRREAAPAAGLEKQRNERIATAREAIRQRPSDYPYFAEIRTRLGLKRLVPYAEVHQFDKSRITSGHRGSSGQYVYRCKNGPLVVSGKHPADGGQHNRPDTGYASLPVGSSKH